MPKYINNVKIRFLQTVPNRVPGLLTPVPLEFMCSTQRSTCVTHQIILKKIYLSNLIEVGTKEEKKNASALKIRPLVSLKRRKQQS